MAWNGTGTFARTQDFSADRDAGSPDNIIDADKMDDELTNLSTGIQACLPINGEQAITGNIDFGSSRAYNLAAPSAINDAVRVDAAIKVHYAAESGAADAYVLTPSPAMSAYETGDMFCFFAGNTNTTASTVNVSALGAKAIQLNGSALSGGEIVQNGLHIIVYDGTQFQLVSGVSVSGYISNVVEDTSPQLGAALDGQGFDLNNLGVVFLTEQAAAEADVAGKGQLWVKTATPNELWFTDDAGTDFQLGILGGITPTDSVIPVGDGTTFVGESGATLRTSIGLGTGDNAVFATSTARVADSSETTGALTSTSANKRVKCSGNITLPSSGMTDGDIILIDPAGTARTVTRPSGHTMYIGDTDSATGTTNAHNIVTAMYHGSSKWTLGGAIA